MDIACMDHDPPSLLSLTEDEIKSAVKNFVWQHDIFPGGSRDGSLQLFTKQASFLNAMDGVLCYRLQVHFGLGSHVFHANFLVKTFQHNASISKCFRKELIFFQRIFPIFLELLPSKNDLPVRRCYFVRADHFPNPILVLEDLEVQGHVSPPVVALDLPHASAAFACLGRLHALGVALCRRGVLRGLTAPEMFPALSEETLYNEVNNPEWHRYIEIGGALMVALGEEAEYKGLDRMENLALRRLVPQLQGMIVETTHPNILLANTLCLMDCNPTSFAFLHDAQGRPTACRLTSVSHIKFCKPAIDLVLLLYAIDSILRQDLFSTHYLDVYYSELTVLAAACYRKLEPSGDVLPMPTGLSLSCIRQQIIETRFLGVARLAIDVVFSCLKGDLEEENVTPWPLKDEHEDKVNMQGEPPSLVEMQERARRILRTRLEYRLEVCSALSQLLHIAVQRYGRV